MGNAVFGITALTSARKTVSFLLLPMIFALVGLLALTVTQLPTQAAQSEVWSATVTTEESPNTEDIGFEYDSGQNFGSLTVNTFIFDGTTHTIMRLVRDQYEDFVEFQVGPNLPSSLVETSTLILGGSSFKLGSTDPRGSSPITYRWTDAGLTFPAGAQVSASLVQLVVPAQPSNFAATVGDDSVTLTWDDPGDPTITKYEYRQSADGGQSWSPDWTDVSDSDKGTTSHVVSGLAAYSEHTFSVRAVNDSGNGSAASITITPGEDLDADDDGLIEVSNLAQFNALRWDLDGDGSSINAGYASAFPTARTGMGCPDAGCIGYELTANLDFDTNGDGVVDSSDDYWNAGAGWEPIVRYVDPGEGESRVTHPFNATFDGGGHTVSNLFINRATDNIGLFGVTGSGSEVRNVGLPSANVTGNQGVGALVGRVDFGKISASFSTGSVTGTSDDIGGLVGRNNSGRIAVSYSTAAVRGDTSVGGLVGYTEEGSITASYATGSASGNANVGGLVGQGGSGSVQASYAIGPVKGTFSDGLVGYGGATISDSYWNTETTDTTGAGGREYGKTTHELQSPMAYGDDDDDDIYANWNVDVDGDGNPDDPWDFGTNQQYPALKIDFNGDNDATWQEFGFQRAVAGFTAIAGNLQVTISWDDFGDPAVSHFEARQSDDGGDTWTTWDRISGSDATTTNHTVTGLTSGVAYTFQIRPVKDYGAGLASESATATPVAPVALNAAPSFVDGPTANRSVAENMPPGTSIGARISATDSDASDSLIYSISRNDDGAFVVDSGGQLSNTKTLNYEQKSSYSITLRVEDNDGATDTIDVSIAVTDVNDPPIFGDGESTIRQIPENSPQGTQIGQPITATDEDDVPRYAVHASSVNDLRVFQFDFDSGQFSVDLTRLDHEAKSSYSLTVEAHDDDDAATFIDVTIEIIDVAEPPPAPGAPTISPAGEAGDTTLNVSWTAPDTTGRPDIIGYDVRFRSGSNQNWTIRSLAGNATSANISGLVPGSTYVMQVSAKNDEGVSPWSSPGTGSTNLPESEQQPPTTPEPTAPPTVAPTVPPTPAPPPPTAQEILTLFEENPEQAGEVVGQLADDDPEEAGRVISESAEENEQAAGQIICSAVDGHSESMGRAVGHAAKANAGSTSNALGTISDDGECVSQLGSVIPVEPWLPEQPPPEGQDQTGQGTWQDVGSPAPVENLMARFFTPIEDAHTDITNLDEPPSGTEPLPPDNIPYAYVDIAHDNFTNDDIVTAHATISVEKEWLSFTQVHQWSVQLSRFDPATTAWIPTQSKRIGEDEEKVYYTVTVPGFSLWAIHGSTEPPALTFVEDNLQINRQPIGIGQFTVVSVDVTNTTDAPATYFANLWVDKQINQTSQILIGAGLTQTVSFPLSIDIAGAYQIRVGSQLSQQPLLVEDPAAPVTPVAQGDLATPTAAPPTVPPTIPAAPPVEPTPTIAPTIPPTPAPVASVPEPTAAPESEEAIVAQVPVIGNVEFSDPNASPGDQVMVTIPITHLGSGESSFDLEIEVGGSVVAQQTVMVPPGETLQVEMPIIAPSDPSDVTVRVNGLAKQAAITPAASGNTGLIIGVVVAAVVILVIIAVIVAVIRRRR